MRTQTAVEPGTLGALARAAARWADEMERDAPVSDLRELWLAANYTVNAFRLAVGAAQWTRGKEGEALPDVKAFVWHHAQLAEFHKRAETLLEGDEAGKIGKHWPLNPGTTFSWLAQGSALAVAYDFARMILGGFRVQMTGECIRPASKYEGPAFVGWRDRTIEELRTHLIPPLPAWPRWEILRDSSALESKLEAEYRQACESAEKKPSTDKGMNDKAAAGGDGQEDAQASPLPDRAKTAYDQYHRALPECTGKAGRAPTDQQCYDWLKAHNDGDTLPAFDTWQRYVRQARKHFGKQKNAPRAGRTFGRSIVSAEDIEPPEDAKAD